MYLRRIKELEEKGASHKDSTPLSFTLEKAMRGDPAMSGGELVHGVEEKDSVSEESAVAMSNVSHSGDVLTSPPSSVSAGGVTEVPTVETTTTDSHGTSSASKGLGAPDHDAKASPSGKTPDKHEEGSMPSGEGSTSVEPTKSAPMVDSSTEGTLAQSVAKFFQIQTDILSAQTKAMAAQSLPPPPPLKHFCGEGSLVGDESFDSWLEQFEERAVLAGWSNDDRKYRLKMHLDKTAFHAYQSLSSETKGDYSAVVVALRKRSLLIDIEELRSAEFYQLTQREETVEEIGIKLQTLARIAFPSIVGKEHNRLLKGRFYQGLLPKWQRKLGAPKPNETFEELYDKARTLERHDQQYSHSAAERNDPKGTKKDNKPASKPEGNPKSNTVESSPKELKRIPNTSQNRLICYNCEKPGHIARECRKPRMKFEAVGRASKSTVLTTVADLTDSQLEQELANQRLTREKKEEHLKSAANISTV